MPRRQTRLFSPLYLARRRALYQGVMRGNRRWLRIGWIIGFLPASRAVRARGLTRLFSRHGKGWFELGLLFTIPGLIRDLVGRRPEHVASVRMPPSTAVRIETFARPTRRQARRAARRAA